MIEIHVETEVPVTEIKALLKHLASPFILEKIARGVFADRLYRLDFGIDSQGNALAPLAEYTLTQKRTPQILVETGDMMNAIELMLGDEVGVEINDPEMVERMLYAIEGSSNRPERDMWSVSDRDANLAGEILMKEVEQWFPSVS